MIVIEPPHTRSSSRSHALRKRELNRFLARAIQSIGLEGEVSVLLTSDAQIRQLNREYRRKDKATDVLSFPAADFENNVSDARKIAGDLAVSLETAARQAAGLGHPLEVEVKILLLHGLLHLAGFDHEKDSGQMARRESRLRKELELPAGLIQRSRGPAKPSSAASSIRVSAIRSVKKTQPARTGRRTS